MSKKQWSVTAKNILKRECRIRDIRYDELARRLSALNIPETTVSVTSKMSRGTFSAAFFLASLKAIGSTILREDEF